MNRWNSTYRGPSGTNVVMSRHNKSEKRVYLPSLVIKKIGTPKVLITISEDEITSEVSLFSLNIDGLQVNDQT